MATTPTVIAPTYSHTYGYDNSATSYDGSNEALDISGVLDTLKATDVPFLTLIGKSSLRDACTQVKHEWLEDEIRGLTSTTTDSDLDDANEDSTTITLGTAGDYLKFRGAAVATGPCDIVRIYSVAGSEIAPVTATADNTITVTRGYFSGSNAVDHTAATTIYIEIIGTFQPQGKATIGTQRITIKANKYNYTQIFEDVYSVNVTQQATSKFIKHNEDAYQMGLIAENMGRLMERTLLHGHRIAPSASTGGTMNGVYAHLSTNVYDKAGAILQETYLRDALVDLWETGAGGDDLYAFVNSAQMIRIGQLLDGYRQAGYSDRTLGTWIKRYETPFGAFTLVLDRHMPNEDVLIIDKSRIGFGPLQGRALGMSPITPTSREVKQYQWTGEYTAEVRQEKAHALIQDLATTGF